MELAFSFYSSLKSIPREMIEATRIYRYSAWQRFWQLEMPFAAIGLMWNSIVSVASGWFVLIPARCLPWATTASSFPGLGSYLQSAHRRPVDIHALLWRDGVVILIIVATDQLVWRPMIAWSDKFKFEQVESADRITSPILNCCAAPRCSVPFPAASLRDGGADLPAPGPQRGVPHGASAWMTRAERKPTPVLIAGWTGGVSVVGWGDAGRSDAEDGDLA